MNFFLHDRCFVLRSNYNQYIIYWSNKLSWNVSSVHSRSNWPNWLHTVWVLNKKPLENVLVLYQLNQPKHNMWNVSGFNMQLLWTVFFSLVGRIRKTIYIDQSYIEQETSQQYILVNFCCLNRWICGSTVLSVKNLASRSNYGHPNKCPLSFQLHSRNLYEFI